jgi:hypothetical protein
MSIHARLLHGGGHLLLKTIGQCSDTRILVDVVTKQSNAVILYNGPMQEDGVSQSYIVLELVDGMPRVELAFGSKGLSLKFDKAVNDGKWHNIGITILGKEVSLTVDNC